MAGTNHLAKRLKMRRLARNRWKKTKMDKKAESLVGHRDMQNHDAGVPGVERQRGVHRKDRGLPGRWWEGDWHATPDCGFFWEIILTVYIQTVVKQFWTFISLNFGSLVSSVLFSTWLNIMRYWRSGIVGQVFRHPECSKCPWYLQFKVWRIRLLILLIIEPNVSLA